MVLLAAMVRLEEEYKMVTKVTAPNAKVHGPVEGTCNWFNLRKGYGFFQTPEGNAVFVHVTNLVKDENNLFILPKKDGGLVRFSYALSAREGHEEDYEVVGKVDVLDRYVPEHATE